MLLRNSRVLVFLAFLVVALTELPGQDTSAQPPEAAQPQTAPSPSAPTQLPDAQGTEPAQDQSGFVFKTHAEEVVLHVTVVDKDRRMVTNLDRNAFTVMEDGKPQPITLFRHEDIPVAMGIVIDNSGSMRDKRVKVGKAALNLVRASNPQDEVFVVNFNDDYYLDQDFTSDIKKLKEALEKIDTKGGTALYDAIVASWQSELKNAKRQKKILFIVTDGYDDASRKSLEETVELLQVENGPTLYAIGILGEEEHPKRAKRALQILAERTGGIAYFPKTVDEVDDISRSVARDIRNQYSIVYRPTTPQSQGGYRTIQVNVKAKGYSRLVARTRSGYYAGQQRSTSGTQ